MKITTPNGTLEGESIEAILKQYGLDSLRGADLRGADLHGADLYGADLHGADLRYADLHGANLRYADLHGANLRYADLYGADLHGANLYGADLHGANLHGADLPELTIAKTSILPDEGDIIGWKKAWTDNEMPPTPVIVKLLIPADAQRSNSTGRKCRASTARVLDLQDKQGNSLPPDTTAYSEYDTDFTYKKGETVSVEDFDTNRWNECATGIHFFITRIEAVEY
ncbi:pentapeptide repeat-containing protein [Bifidobacterium pseudocatenulatum]|uniref:Pentapeptide repeat-containing protein n=1 Tax=Bifidobacterium pseudocatenulatum TaxID=28026 RepID=A0AAQ0LWK8_BIFPS|nr:pentapeptide repeat-containing protein [Bifidobacterium pseudocatenulatum]RHL95368.1 pentapeptide repeat-containing protein [Bifidobacterium pseudocatenulatum]